MATSTSFRISDTARTTLAAQATREGTSATSLLERLIVEGIQQLDFPGITFRGPTHDRRAALTAGPDVWEVIGRLQQLEGSEEHRVMELSAETDLHPRLIRLAIDYAAENSAEIQRRIENNRQRTERSQKAAAGREALLG